MKTSEANPYGAAALAISVTAMEDSTTMYRDDQVDEDRDGRWIGCSFSSNPTLSPKAQAPHELLPWGFSPRPRQTAPRRPAEACHLRDRLQNAFRTGRNEANGFAPTSASQHAN